jgi:hypothetical protein
MRLIRLPKRRIATRSRANARLRPILRRGVSAPIAVKAAAVERIAELIPNVAELDVDALDELEQLNVVANGARPRSRR